MSPKTIVTIGVIAGSTIGGFIPVILGASLFSYWSLVGDGVGGIIGLIIAYKLAVN